MNGELGGPHAGHRGVLYVIVCAAPPALDVGRFLPSAQGRGWDTCLVATPRAARWLDLAELEALTGHPVRSDYKLPHEPDVLPAADAMVLAPATFNTLNKWAAGISDTLALGLVCEAIGLGLPLVAVPYLNAAQARHPALPRSVATLRAAGVRVLFGPEVLTLHHPGNGDSAAFPWRRLLDELDVLRPVAGRSPTG